MPRVLKQYGLIGGARISAPIEVYTLSEGRVLPPDEDGSPSIRLWISGHDYLGPSDLGQQLNEVPRASFEWNFNQSARAAETREDRFFLPWATLGMSGPPRDHQRVAFFISEVHLLDMPRGGAWLEWNDPIAPTRHPEAK